MAIRLTNSQIARKGGDDLNGQLQQALTIGGYPVLTYDEWKTGNGPKRFGSPLPVFVREYPFRPARPTWDYRKLPGFFEGSKWRFTLIKPPRLWRWDFFCPARNIAIEIDGGTFTKGGKGGHSRGAQSARDSLKRNEAEIDGLTVLRFDVNMIRHGIAIDFINRALAIRI